MAHKRNNYNRRRNILPIARAVGVMAAIAIVVSGITFAVLQSQ